MQPLYSCGQCGKKQLARFFQEDNVPFPLPGANGPAIPMKRSQNKSSRVSLADVAQAANISKAAACYALQNRPKVSAATRRLVLRVARKLGYAPDARLASCMKGVRDTKAKELLPIAWLNTYADRDIWHIRAFMSPYLKGAEEEAFKSGYRIDEIWAGEPGMTMRRISQILYQRGIEGVIISYPARHFRLRWDHLVGVSLGRGLLAPRLPQVTTDFYFNFLLALKMARRSGHRRIGVCLEEAVDRRHAYHAIRATIHYLNATVAKSRRVEPLFYPWSSNPTPALDRKITRWLQQQRPDAVICHNHHMLAWVKQAGFRVPDDIGIVHLATDDDVRDWAGICSNKRQIGANAVKLVASLLQSRQFGIPETAANVLIRGSWQGGWTLRRPGI